MALVANFKKNPFDIPFPEAYIKVENYTYDSIRKTLQALLVFYSGEAQRVEDIRYKRVSLESELVPLKDDYALESQALISLEGEKNTLAQAIKQKELSEIELTEQEKAEFEDLNRRVDEKLSTLDGLTVNIQELEERIFSMTGSKPIYQTILEIPYLDDTIHPVTALYSHLKTINLKGVDNGKEIEINFQEAEDV